MGVTYSFVIGAGSGWHSTLAMALRKIDMHCPTLPRQPSPISSTRHHPPAEACSHEQALETLFARVATAARLPFIAERLLNLTSDALVTTSDLREIIQSDAALTANVLRRVNSTYFGLSRQVTDLATAITLMGIEEIRNVALTVFVERMFDSPGNYATYSRESLWRHSCAVATTARKIARVTNAVPADDAYIAGLLHHVGTLLIDQHLRASFCQIIDRLDGLTPTYIVERQVLTFDHAQLGAYVVREWNFPVRICDAIRHYAHPEDYPGDHVGLVSVVSVANYLCNRIGFTSLGVHNSPPPIEESYAAVGLTRFTLKVIWDELTRIFHPRPVWRATSQSPAAFR